MISALILAATLHLFVRSSGVPATPLNAVLPGTPDTKTDVYRNLVLDAPHMDGSPVVAWVYESDQQFCFLKDGWCYIGIEIPDFLVGELPNCGTTTAPCDLRRPAPGVAWREECVAVRESADTWHFNCPAKKEPRRVLLNNALRAAKPLPPGVVECTSTPRPGIIDIPCDWDSSCKAGVPLSFAYRPDTRNIDWKMQGCETFEWCWSAEEPCEMGTQSMTHVYKYGGAYQPSVKVKGKTEATTTWLVINVAGPTNPLSMAQRVGKAKAAAAQQQGRQKKVDQ
jgi:hypothetical protein